MKSSTFTFKDQDGVDIFVYKWVPDGKPKAVVQVSHGLQEYAGRYAQFGEKLTSAGYIVYANDQRGHGKTAGGIEKLGRLGPGGWDSAVKVLKQLTDIIKKENPGLPVFLWSHSWGSFMAQNYIERWGGELKGAILSGTHGKDPLLILAPLLAKRAIKKEGPDATGGLLQKMAITSLNKTWEPSKTGKDWLTRDETEVTKYINDPFCGKPLPHSYFLDLANLLKNTWNKANELKIPKDLPIYLYAGTRDPVGKFNKTIKALVGRYQKYGIKDVTTKFYADGRHEMHNELNRDEVYKDLIAWLDAHV